ncbi:MAG: RMD1 family protein [Deltaproteobacteria bacterium]|nr:RMD1 family protein [Deltaproteobacteria bacterium]
MPAQVHQFYAVAFEENLSLRQVAPSFPGARITAHELSVPIGRDGGAMYVYPFGAVVTHDVSAERRDAELGRLRGSMPKLTTQVVREDYSVLEDPSVEIGVADGMLRVDRLTPGRAGIVALTVAQSAAMEYYERIVEDLFERTGRLVELLERRGTVPYRIRPLHRFIGGAVSTRTEVLSVLHLLDKPDAAWDDAAMDRIYDDLRAEFDLADRYAALERKVQSIQEALVLVLDVARDRRMLILEAAIVVLILVEIVLGLLKLT